MNRWNYGTVDPNRNFGAGSPSRDAAALIEPVRGMAGEFMARMSVSRQK
jgi:hypothetical protein